MIEIDGSFGEGGGQILRTSVTLSVLTGTPLRISNIRAGRSRPGLARQHLTAVRAAAEVSGAALEGAELGSTALAFRPGRVRPGEYRFSTRGAGSTTLVLQTLLLPLLLADGPSKLELEGGTHNPFAPPFEFLDRTFLPLLRRMGARMELELARPGFYPAGGGRLAARIEPASSLSALELEERGAERDRRARALVSALPRHIAERELRVVGERLDIPEGRREAVVVEEPAGPGNAVLVEVECERVTGVFTGFGQKGVPAEEVAGRVADEAVEWLEAGVPVGRHLQDQLLLPLAVAGAGAYRTLEPTSHTRTSIEVIRRFLDVTVSVDALADGTWRVAVAR